eukprot:TRINITY_DN209_c0_g1_i10.p1 TRINITY_DN209_c0_g1~~TRINITY_DN209_c0_g1_i10.p1  ORF type:complete len:279 (-),score=33.00 TRINITY_DN209_c0_g1_i10:1087-1923(-)
MGGVWSYLRGNATAAVAVPAKMPVCDNQLPPPGSKVLYKMLLLGESNAGKSSLHRRVQYDSFGEYYGSFSVEFCIKTYNVPPYVVKCQFWDTAGQERFRAISSAYYRRASCVILCFDLTDRDSFKGLDRWVGQVVSMSNIHPLENIVVMVCGCKCDLVKERAIGLSEIQTRLDLMRKELKQIGLDSTSHHRPPPPVAAGASLSENTTASSAPFTDVSSTGVNWKLAFAQRCTHTVVSYCETSAKTGQGVEEMMQQLCELFVESWSCGNVAESLTICRP